MTRSEPPEGPMRGPLLVRDLPRSERPRERLWAVGAASLADAELLAILIRTGRRGSSALDVARELLAEQGGLEGLLEASGPSLRREGIGEAKAAALLAAVEIGRRLARSRLSEREPLGSPSAVARYLALRYRRNDQEVMGALYLDVRHRLISEVEVFRGTLRRAAVEPRALLKEALLRGASGLVLFHTHPSGDPSPSAEDLAFTRRMVGAAELVGVQLVDHLVLGGGGRWVSLRQRAAW